MPWTLETFRKHNKNACAAGVKAANAALKRGLSEGAAVRIGNAVCAKAREKRKVNPAKAL